MFSERGYLLKLFDNFAQRWGSSWTVFRRECSDVCVAEAVDAEITSVDSFQQHEPLLFLFQPCLEGAFWNVQGQESSRAAAASHY